MVITAVLVVVLIYVIVQMSHNTPWACDLLPGKKWSDYGLGCV